MDIAAYISGFVDGEGCFTVSFSPRRKLLVGWEVRPSFSASQNAERADVLFLMERYFGCGSIRPDRSDRTLKYEVRAIADLTARILPHFERHPLQSQKQADFQRFAKVCRLVHSGGHLTAGGLREIVGVAVEMNPSGRRRFGAQQIVDYERLKI